MSPKSRHGSKPSRRNLAAAANSRAAVDSAPPGSSGPTDVVVELGDLRIHVPQAEDVPAVLQPFMQMASKKSLSQWFGVSPRTLRRWELEGRLPPWEGQTMAQVVSRLITLPGSGA